MIRLNEDTYTSPKLLDTASVPADPEITPLFVYSRSTNTFTTGKTGAPLNILLRRGPIASFSVFPELPRGLLLDTRTGTISGTPSVVTEKTSFTVTATNEQLFTTAVVIAITVEEDDAEFRKASDYVPIERRDNSNETLLISNGERDKLPLTAPV